MSTHPPNPDNVLEIQVLHDLDKELEREGAGNITVLHRVLEPIEGPVQNVSSLQC